MTTKTRKTIRESEENTARLKGIENAGTSRSPQEEIEQDGIPAFTPRGGRIGTSAKTFGENAPNSREKTGGYPGSNYSVVGQLSLNGGYQ